MTTKIEKLVLTIGKKKLSLTLDEAKSLYVTLNELFEKEAYTYINNDSTDIKIPNPYITYYDRGIQEQTKPYPGLVDPIKGPSSIGVTPHQYELTGGELWYW